MKKEVFALYDNHPIGYEIKGIENFRACKDRNIQECIVVKGISDFGDGEKMININY